MTSRGGPLRGRRARAGAGLLAVAALALLALPAAAQQTGSRDDLDLAVVALTGALAPGGELAVGLRVSNGGERDAEGLRVVGTLYSPVASRLAFQLAVDDGRLGAVLDGFSAEIDLLRSGRSTSVKLNRTAAQLGFRRADQFGVYPLRLQLLDRGEVVDEVRTAVVFTAERVDEPVRTALVVPVAASPLPLPDGTYDRSELLSELGHGGRVQGLVGSLQARPGFPATLAPDSLLLDEAADIAGGFRLAESPRDGTRPPVVREVGPEDYLAVQARRLLERTAEVTARQHVDVLALPYGRADLTALVRGDMTAEAVRHVEEPHAVAAELGVSPVAGALWPPDALNPATLAAVVGTGTDTLVLSERHLDIPEGRALSPSPLRDLARTRGTSPTVLVPDPWLEEVLARESTPDGVPVAVQRVLAETAAVYFERPFADAVRGLLLAPPQSWAPERGLAGGLMDAIAEAPWLAPVPLSRLLRTVEPEASPVRLRYDTAARERELSSAYVAALGEARRSLGSLAGVLTGDADTPSRLDRLLRAAASVEFRNRPEAARGRAMIAGVADTVTNLYSSVAILEGPQVWMEAEGPVPVTVANNAEVPLRVRVRLLSQRFVFDLGPEGQVVDLDPGETRTLTVQARAVTPGGRAPVSVVVQDVDGVLTLAESTVVVRSTAASMAAVVVTAAAGLFLFAWVVQQGMRRRGRPRPGAPAESPRPTARAGGRRSR
ncbi:MAG TPA: DUF6049 family protein [Egibacteraceae bacterium]|nr:DUF6049 family protein [Egibacteraceae bacterium]